MKQTGIMLIAMLLFQIAFSQIDPELLRDPGTDRDSMRLNMDAVYSRPFVQAGKLPIALGGYAEANYQYTSEDGIAEGHQFQMRRVTLFVSSILLADVSAGCPSLYDNARAACGQAVGRRRQLDHAPCPRRAHHGEREPVERRPLGPLERGKMALQNRLEVGARGEGCRVVALAVVIGTALLEG